MFCEDKCDYKEAKRAKKWFDGFFKSICYVLGAKE
jgi:hypothetical protein